MPMIRAGDLLRVAHGPYPRCHQQRKLQYAYILVRTRQGARYREATAWGVTDLFDVMRGGDYAEYLFALGWRELIDGRLPVFQHLVRFAEMLSEMLGEMNVSHTGCYYRPNVPTSDTTDIRQHSAFHRYTIADRVYPVK